MPETMIAAQMYTVRDFTKTPEDIAESLKKVKAIGYDAMQVSGFGPIDPQELKHMADGEGLDIIATHTGFDRMRDDIQAVIDHELNGVRAGHIHPEARSNTRSGAERGRAAHGHTDKTPLIAERGALRIARRTADRS